MTNHIKIVIIIFLIISGFQSLSQEIPKNANSITIVPKINIKEIARLFIENGYIIEKTDSEFGIITTKFKDVKRVTIALSIMYDSTSTILTGQFKTPSIDNSPSQICNRGMAGSPAMIAWEEMNKVAGLIGDPMEYKAK